MNRPLLTGFFLGTYIILVTLISSWAGQINEKVPRLLAIWTFGFCVTLIPLHVFWLRERTLMRASVVWWLLAALPWIVWWSGWQFRPAELPIPLPTPTPAPILLP